MIPIEELHTRLGIAMHHIANHGLTRMTHTHDVGTYGIRMTVEKVDAPPHGWGVGEGHRGKSVPLDDTPIPHGQTAEEARAMEGPTVTVEKINDALDEAFAKPMDLSSTCLSDAMDKAAPAPTLMEVLATRLRRSESADDTSAIAAAMSILDGLTDQTIRNSRS